jgi:glycosyltransferase involved in cell wall biosynthesis
MVDQPVVSIIVPARNAEKFIRRQVEALLSQESRARFEVVVVDNRSTDKTRAVVESLISKDARLRIVNAPDNDGASYARNVGVRSTSSEYILITDADDVVHAGWVEEFVGAFAEGAKVVGGILRYVDHDGKWLFTESGVYPTSWAGPGVAGSACGFARGLFDAVGGFDEDMKSGFDDIDFFVRAGYRGFTVSSVPGAVIDYYQREHTAEIYQQWFRYGQGYWDLFDRHRRFGMSSPRRIKVRLAIVAEFIVRMLRLRRSPASRFVGLRRLARNEGIARHF